jgi:O-antigen/teichoic acid export membrane protein
VEVAARPAATALRRLGTQVAAGLGASAVTMAAMVVTTPIYLRSLGAEAYGVLAFVLVLQAVLLTLDAGIGLSITRVVALGQQDPAVGALVRGLDRTCWVVAAIIALLVGFAAAFLAEHWLQLGTLDRRMVVHALVWGGLAIGVRWPIALYQGILAGAQRMGQNSAVAAAATLLAALGGALLMTWNRGLVPLLAWLGAVGLVQALACRHLAMNCVPRARPSGWPGVYAFLRASSAAAGLGVVGLLVMQVDKAVLSKALPVAEFAYYSVAALVVPGLLSLVGPIFNVLYPRLALRGDDPDANLYRNATLAIGVFVTPVAAGMAVFGESLLYLWMGDAEAARVGGPVLFWLALGAAQHAIMHAPPALTLASGRVRLALGISSVQLGLTVPAMLAGAALGGAHGAAVAWFGVNTCYLFAGSWVTHRALLPSVHRRWMLEDVLPSLTLSLAIAFAVSALLPESAYSAAARCVAMLLSVLASWLLAILVSRRLRVAVREFLALRGAC